MRILWIMKKSKVAVTLVCAMMVMMLATGCGEEKEAPIPVDLSSENLQDGAEDLTQDAEEGRQNNDEGGDRSSGEDNQSDAEDKESSQADGDRRTEADKQETKEDNSSQTFGSEELVGDIRGGIGQDSFALCKHTIESDGNVAVAVAPGAEEADDLVTVYVNPGCIYRYKTIRNGGINPEDISEREGSFGDLKEGLTCILKGSWKDSSFYADSIEMEEFG